MVYALNKQRVKKYMEYYNLEEPAKNGPDLFHKVRDKYLQYNYE